MGLFDKFLNVMRLNPDDEDDFYDDDYYDEEEDEAPIMKCVKSRQELLRRSRRCVRPESRYPQPAWKSV